LRRVDRAFGEAPASPSRWLPPYQAGCFLGRTATTISAKTPKRKPSNAHTPALRFFELATIALPATLATHMRKRTAFKPDKGGFLSGRQMVSEAISAQRVDY
jgi:hypothetical protein